MYAAVAMLCADAAKKDKKGKKDKKPDYIFAVLVRNLDFPGMSIDTVKEAFSKCGGIIGVRLRMDNTPSSSSLK